MLTINLEEMFAPMHHIDSNNPKEVAKHIEKQRLLNFQDSLIENFAPCAKTIIQRLKGYVDEFVVPEMKPYIFIAGGSIASLVHEHVNMTCDTNTVNYGDIDFWLREIPPKDVRKAQYKKLAEFELYDSSQEYPAGMQLKKAFTFVLNSGDVMASSGFNAFQFIVKFRGTPKEITDSFDFEHVRPFYDVTTEKLHINQSQMWSIIKKQLIPDEKTKISIDKFIEFGKMPKLKPVLAESDKAEATMLLRRLEKYYTRGYKYNG